MSDLKTSQFGTITAIQANVAGVEGYIPYVDPSQTDPDLRNKRMTRSEAKKFFGLDVFTALSGTAWDGTNKTLTLTVNTALTFSSTKRNGILRVKQDGIGGRTLSINSISVPVASGANTITAISYFYDDVAATYVFSYDTNILGNVGGVGGGGDTTAPTVTGIVASDAHTITIGLSETTTGFNGFTLKKGGVAMSITAHSFPTSSSIQFTVSDTMLTTDTLTADYAPGDVVDTSSNALASFTAHSVTNSIGSSTVDIPFTSVTALTESPSHVWNSTVTGYNNYGLASLYLPAAADGYIETQYVASDAESAVFGFSTTNAQVGHAAMLAGMSTYLGEIYKDDGGVISNTTATIANGNWTRLLITGSVIKLQKSTDHTTWTDVATLTATRTTDLYIVCNISYGGKLYYPKGSNLT